MSELAVPGASLYYETRGTGPLLVVLPGGDGDAHATAALVDQLAKQFTVVTYDRRGLSRSKLADGAALGIATHADDVHLLLTALTDEPALVFGSSIGAVIALELVARHPGQVRRVVAHEPPSSQFLAEPERVAFAADQEAIEMAFARDGIPGAMPRFGALVGLDFDDREPDVALPKPGPERVANLTMFLTHDAPAVRQHHLDTDLLRAAAAKIVVAIGATSMAFAPARCAEGLAALLGTRPVTMPGGHVAPSLRPQAFAAALVAVLA